MKLNQLEKSTSYKSIFDPINYLEKIYDEFYFNLTHENNLTHEVANKIYHVLNSILVEVKNKRQSVSITREFLNTELKKLYNKELLLIETWLIKVLNKYITYTYAYNVIVQKANRNELDWDKIPLKPITDTDLFVLIEYEQNINTNEALILYENKVKEVENKLNSIIERKNKSELAVITNKNNNAKKNEIPINQPVQENENTIRSETLEKVEENFKFMLGTNERGGKPVMSLDDYYRLVKWVCYFFENNKIKKIEDPIKNYNYNQRKTINAFCKLYKEIKPNSDLYPTIFKLMQECILEFRQKNIESLRRSNKEGN